MTLSPSTLDTTIFCGKPGSLLILKATTFEEDIIAFHPTSNTGLNHLQGSLGLQNTTKRFFFHPGHHHF